MVATSDFWLIFLRVWVVFFAYFPGSFWVPNILPISKHSRANSTQIPEGCLGTTLWQSFDLCLSVSIKAFYTCHFFYSILTLYLLSSLLTFILSPFDVLSVTSLVPQAFYLWDNVAFLFNITFFLLLLLFTFTYMCIHCLCHLPSPLQAEPVPSSSLLQ
jgi:hypothetical protein